MDQIDSAYKVLSISHQCKVLGISSEEYGCPAIFNTDQGSLLIKVLVDYDIQISMDGKERLWITSELSVFGEVSNTRPSILNAMKK